MHHNAKLLLLLGLLMLIAFSGLFVGAASLSISQVMEHLIAFSSAEFVIQQ